ncbi:chloride channel protein, partial [Synechococcus sp. UW140]|uniref:chloride channel protein n=1 Tax=Synechococcus sp. UW140 TaxID=368503 RepID=UPI0025F2FFCA
WLQQLSLVTQMRRLPLMLLTHLGGLAVGVESPSVALGASMLLAIRRRWPGFQLLASLPSHLVAVIGGAAGLGVAFRSPLLAFAYGLEELGHGSCQERCHPLEAFYASFAKVTWRLVCWVANGSFIHTKSGSFQQHTYFLQHF